MQEMGMKWDWRARCFETCVKAEQRWEPRVLGVQISWLIESVMSHMYRSETARLHIKFEIE